MIIVQLVKFPAHGKIAVVADGVGSCKHAEIAVKNSCGNSHRVDNKAISAI